MYVALGPKNAPRSKDSIHSDSTGIRATHATFARVCIGRATFLSTYAREIRRRSVARLGRRRRRCAFLIHFRLHCSLGSGWERQRFGFQVEIKENKTPGGEHYLDPPGAELLSLVFLSQATRERFSRGLALRLPYQPTCRRRL
jgi:hypothetical protein